MPSTPARSDTPLIQSKRAARSQDGTTDTQSPCQRSKFLPSNLKTSQAQAIIHPNYNRCTSRSRAPAVIDRNQLTPHYPLEKYTLPRKLATVLQEYNAQTAGRRKLATVLQEYNAQTGWPLAAQKKHVASTHVLSHFFCPQWKSLEEASRTLFHKHRLLSVPES